MRPVFLRKFDLPWLPLFILLLLGIGPCFAGQGSVSSKEELTGRTGDIFTYRSKGRRDPFKALVQKNRKVIKEASGRPDSVKGPLEKFELSQYRLVALMVVKGTPRAMVKAPDGKGYTVMEGDYIGLNDGIVKTIEPKVIGLDENDMRIEKSPDRIIVEEIGIDTLTGKKVTQYRYIVM